MYDLEQRLCARKVKFSTLETREADQPFFYTSPGEFKILKYNDYSSRASSITFIISV